MERWQVRGRPDDECLDDAWVPCIFSMQILNNFWDEMGPVKFCFILPDGLLGIALLALALALAWLDGWDPGVM